MSARRTCFGRLRPKARLSCATRHTPPIKAGCRDLSGRSRAVWDARASSPGHSFVLVVVVMVVVVMVIVVVVVMVVMVMVVNVNQASSTRDMGDNQIIIPSPVEGLLILYR